MITTSTSPGTYLNLALYGFVLLGLEIVLLLVEPILPFTSGSIEAAIAHWVLTITVWAGGSIALLTWARRHTDFCSRGAQVRTRSAPARWLAIVLIVAATLAAQYALRGAFPLVAEHAALSERFGSAGTLTWIVQVIYYVAEVAVTALIIGFGQRAGEGWFHRTWMPWGGIFLALTWGLTHVLTQDPATGVYGVALSLMMGIAYLLAGRRLAIAYPILLVLFIL